MIATSPPYRKIFTRRFIDESKLSMCEMITNVISSLVAFLMAFQFVDTAGRRRARGFPTI